jgi:chromosome segregation ATPase
MRPLKTGLDRTGGSTAMEAAPPPPPPPSNRSAARRKFDELVGYGRSTRQRQMQVTEPARLREEAARLRFAAARNQHRAAKLETSVERHHHAAAELEEKRAQEQQRLHGLEGNLQNLESRTSPSEAQREVDGSRSTNVPEAKGRLQRQKLREKIASRRRKLAALEHRIAEHRTAAENRRAMAQQLQANAQRDQREAESYARQAQESRGPENAPAPQPAPRLT